MPAKIQYVLQEHVENVQYYQEEGYHPVQLHDTFADGRYEVVHKLGDGSYSVVWLARDHLKGRYVSLKILTGFGSKSDTDVTIRNHLENGRVKSSGSRFVASFFDEFCISGPNGQHKCQVSELVGHTLRQLQRTYRSHTLPLNIAKRALVQLVSGLAYIHGRGVMHGDLYPQNIAFSFPKIDHWSIDRIYSNSSIPEKRPIVRKYGEPLGPEAPPYTVIQAHFWNMGEATLTKEVRIIDFGEASFTSTPRTELNIPTPYYPPEAIFGEAIGLPADIWALACTIFEMFSFDSLFGNVGSNYDALLANMISTLGPLPEAWDKRWDAKSTYFDEHGSRRPHPFLPSHCGPPPLRTQVGRMRRPDDKEVEQLSEKDAEGLLQVLQAGLKFRPEERATAEELLQLPWMKKLRKEENICRWEQSQASRNQLRPSPTRKRTS